MQSMLNSIDIDTIILFAGDNNNLSDDDHHHDSHTSRSSSDSLCPLSYIHTFTLSHLQEQCRLVVGAGGSVGLEERLWRRRREAEAL